MAKHTMNRNWPQIVAACRNSGLTDHQWCIENGIPASTFYNHLKKLRREACEIPESVGKNTLPVKQDVVQINVADDGLIPSLGEAPAITLRINGIGMDVSNHASSAVIAATLQALSAIC